MFDNLNESKILVVGSVVILLAAWILVLIFVVIRPLRNERNEAAKLAFDLAFLGA